MYRKTKNQLIAVIIVLIVITIVAWYLLLPRPHVIRLTNLAEISYSPPSSTTCPSGACPPNFTFKFSSPLPASVAAGTAVLKSFTLSPISTTNAAMANYIIGVLIKNSVPFTPVMSNSHTITSNTMPAAVRKIIVQPVSFAGIGEMDVTIPASK